MYRKSVNETSPRSQMVSKPQYYTCKTVGSPNFAAKCFESAEIDALLAGGSGFHHRQNDDRDQKHGRDLVRDQVEPRGPGVAVGLEVAPPAGEQAVHSE